MNKPVIFGAGAAIVALGAAPYFIGNSVQQRVNAAITGINDMPVYSANVVSYEKGWFSSTADIELAFDLNALMAAQQLDPQEVPTEENPSIMATLVAHHGPVFFSNDVGIGKVQYTVSIDAEALREHMSWDKNKPLYINTGAIGLLGGLAYSDEIPAFVAEGEDGFSASFSGFKGKANQQGENIVYTSEKSSFAMSDNTFSFSMNDLDMTMTFKGDFMKALKGELFESEATANIASIIVAGLDEQKGEVKLDKLSFVTNTEINEATNTANVYVEYALEKAVGPDMEASDMALGLAINNLELDFVKAYQEFNNNALTVPADQLGDKLKGFVQDNLLSQLQVEPEINITKLKATVPEGSFTAQANTKLVGITALPGTMEDAAYWISHLLADAKISADKAFAESMTSGYMMGQILANPQAQNMSAEEVKAAADQQAPMMLNAFAEQGFLKITEQGYETDLEFKDGKATVNGTPIPLPFAPQ